LKLITITWAFARQFIIFHEQVLVPKHEFKSESQDIVSVYQIWKQCQETNGEIQGSHTKTVGLSRPHQKV